MELVGEDDAEDILGDLTERGGGEAMRSGDRFVGFYSRSGVLTVLEAYGVSARLERLGLTPWELRLSSDGGGRHRLEVLLEGGGEDDHRLIDLVVELRRVREIPIGDGRCDTEVYDVLVVEWLALQNPRAGFTTGRPQLPGQHHPGLGIGRTVHNMILLMARRLGRDGVLNVPRHFHLAVFYDRFGYRFLCEAHQTEVRVVAGALLGSLPMAAVSWAVERGLVELDRGGGFEPWMCRPVEMLAPVSERLQDRLGRDGGWFRRLISPRPRFRVRLDRAGLVESLRSDPVPGLDPETLAEARQP